MIKNYLKLAWRNLIRQKVFSAINIIGLALGLACSLVIMMWVQDERSVDAFHVNGKQLYQVYERQVFDNGDIGAGYHTQGLLADELKRVVPEVIGATPLRPGGRSARWMAVLLAPISLKCSVSPCSRVHRLLR